MTLVPHANDFKGSSYYGAFIGQPAFDLFWHRREIAAAGKLRAVFTVAAVEAPLDLLIIPADLGPRQDGVGTLHQTEPSSQSLARTMVIPSTF